MNSAPIRRDGRRAPYDREVLRRKRVEAGLSQVRLAKITGLSTSLISALECGVHGASPDTIARLARGLGCTAPELMKESA